MQHMVSLVQLGAGLEECAPPYAAFVKEIINSLAPEDGRVSPKYIELK